MNAISPSVRVERIGNATLYCGDCRDILPTLSGIDAVVTDPPYGISYKSGPNSRSSINSVRKRFTETICGDDEPFDPAHILRLGCPLAVTGAQHFYDRLPSGGAFHVWNKRGPYEPIDQADGDLIWTSRRSPLRVIDIVWRGLCRSVENHSPIVHPTQKPVLLMARCIELAGIPDGALIMDPYAGSGTTILAAIRGGRPAIGIEIDPKHFATMCERVQASAKQNDLFLPPAEDPADTRMADLFHEPEE